MATVRERNGRFQVQIRIRGFPNRSETFETVEEAYDWAAKCESTMRCDNSAGLDSASDELRVFDLIERYRQTVLPWKRSAEVEGHILNGLARADFANLRLTELRTIHLATYRDHRLARVGPATFRREFGLLCHVLRYGSDEWAAPVDMAVCKRVRLPRLPRGRERRLSASEERRLIAACETARNPWLEPVILFALETGMRQSEITSLQWPHVDLDRQTALLPMTKNGRARTVPLSTRATAILRDVRADAVDGRVFPTSSEAVKRAFARAVDRAGIEGLRFHDLRHEAVSRLFERGFQMPEVMLISGHTDYRSLLRYTHLSAASLVSRLG